MGDHYEDNILRMVGVRPAYQANPIPVGAIPDRGTQVIKSGAVTGDTVVIHTVDVAKTFYLSHYNLHSANHSGAARDGNLLVTNASDTHQYYIARIYMDNDISDVISGSFMPPLEIPAGWKIWIMASDTLCDSVGTIHGYEM